jgi:ammonia channel protein AmtB
MKFHDTCQNFSLHGVPAIFGGLLAAVFSVVSVLKVPRGFTYVFGKSYGKIFINFY